MARLRYVIGTVEAFETINADLTASELPVIDISTSRRSLDGTQTFVHQELLDDAQMGRIMHSFANGGAWNLMSDDNPDFSALMQSQEWTLLEPGEGLPDEAVP